MIQADIRMWRRSYMRGHEEVAEYVEWQSQYKCKVVSAKPEQEFDDLGINVRVWNVKTDIDGAWWVVEGDEVPMNLYPQQAYYFGTDEVYSFHMGLMTRMKAGQCEYRPEDYVAVASVESEIAPQLLRRLKSIATLIDSAVEIEDFQTIGVQCREVLVELASHVYVPFMSQGEEQPKGADVKQKLELFVKFHYAGSGNKDYRSIYKKMVEGAWEFVCKLTHSTNATYYEVSSCVAMCISVVSVVENIRQKAYDPIAAHNCRVCKSKRLEIVGDEHDEETGYVSKLTLECEECGECMEITFD